MNPSDDGIYTAYLEGSLKLSKSGEWWHNGRPFQNDRLSALFSRHVVWDTSANRYVIRIGGQQATFDCEDTAYFVLAIEDERFPWVLHLSDGSSEVLDPSTLSRGKEDQLYCRVHGTHRARFGRAAHQNVLRFASSDDHITVHGREISIGRSSE